MTDFRSAVDEADERALFETSPAADQHVAESNRSSVGDLDRGHVRRQRSEDSEIDNVDALNVDEERLARVRENRYEPRRRASTQHSLTFRVRTCN